VLLIVGMLGLYAHQPEGGAKVLEYGDPNVRYVLAELADEEPRTATRQIPVQTRRAAAGGLRPAGRAVRRAERGREMGPRKALAALAGTTAPAN
jgi:hypothetical protein